ncbi:ClpXP protease specificity-enhancing factor SspB [Magnetococcus sp. PR-3]|uniref:ClpXP protease specificity-enhancing factor SspB n=1 Tax=Magnetococcus sp. PR-3 TaxID=3120355 RepID=UPI002FCDFE6F
MVTTEQPTKPDVIRYLLEEEGRVMLCVDATQEQAEVPRRFANDNSLRLVLNRQMPQPIHVGEDAVESELRFGGIPHYCIIPYGTLWGAFNPDTGHGMLWPDSMPNDVRQNYWLSQSLQQEGGFEMPEGALEQVKKLRMDEEQAQNNRPQLQIVEGHSSEPPAVVEPPTDEDPPPQRPKPSLRLVK